MQKCFQTRLMKLTIFMGKGDLGLYWATIWFNLIYQHLPVLLILAQSARKKKVGRSKSNMPQNISPDRTYACDKIKVVKVNAGVFSFNKVVGFREMVTGVKKTEMLICVMKSKFSSQAFFDWSTQGEQASKQGEILCLPVTKEKSTMFKFRKKIALKEYRQQILVQQIRCFPLFFS